jgi:hypothetical protein
MSAPRLAPGRTSGRRFLFNVILHPLFKRFRRDAFLNLVACVILLVPMSVHGQSASDVAESRLACAQGLGQQAVNRAREMGFQMGLADVCVKALSWTANNGKLLDLYASDSGQGNARQLVNRIADNARSSVTPFRATGSAQEMLNNGQLIPSVAFDAGFTRSFLEKTAPPSGSIDMAALKGRTEGCLTENQSLAICAEVGRIQGALAYQTSNAFSHSSATPAAITEPQGPDRAQTGAAIDQKFRNWSQSWSWDRYSPGSAHVSSIDCSGQCKASGQFTFTRLGVPHTIPFVAFIQSEDGGKYSLGRLCYDDSTTGTRDCTE